MLSIRVKQAIYQVVEIYHVTASICVAPSAWNLALQVQYDATSQVCLYGWVAWKYLLINLRFGNLVTSLQMCARMTGLPPH